MHNSPSFLLTSPIISNNSHALSYIFPTFSYTSSYIPMISNNSHALSYIFPTFSYTSYTFLTYYMPVLTQHIPVLTFSYRFLTHILLHIR